MSNENGTGPLAKRDPNHNSNLNPQDRNRHQPFQVQNIPKGIFPMFYESSDPFIYDKKFYCDLPQVITATKSFHYPFSMESFCQFDLLTMVFDLKTNCEILTDPKLNTLIHQDFINNSLELISPNLTQTTNNANTEQLKKDILAIVERQEDIPNEKKSAMHTRSFYLRNSTYFRTSLNVKSNNQGVQFKKKTKALGDSISLSTEEAKKIIAKTFNDINSIQVGKEHPVRTGVTARNVYDVLPYTKLGGNDFCQFIFPIDPSQEAKVNEKFETPTKFIMKKKANSDIYSLYQNEHLKATDKTNEKNVAEYYSYDKDYTLTSNHQYGLFNRFFIFVNKEKKTAKFASISNKYTLKKFKRPLAHRNEGEEGEDEEDYLLRRKRERDMIVIPKEIEEESLFKRNQWIKQNGFPFEFVGQDIQDVDYTEVEEIKKEKHLSEKYVSDEEKQGNPKKGEEEEEEEEDYFGQGNEEERSFNDRHSDDHSRSNFINEDDNKEGSEIDNKNQAEEEDEDALFSEKEANNSNTRRNASKLIDDNEEGNDID